MLQSISAGIVLTLCAAAAGVTLGQARLTAQGRGPSDSNQAGAFHQEFAPASKVSEPYQILFQPRQLKESQPKLWHGEGPSQAHSSKRLVCGLALMAVDPKADPKMSQPLQPEANGKQPAASAPEPKVRRIEPTVCRD
jgi:hypothetical protein